MSTRPVRLICQIVFVLLSCRSMAAQDVSYADSVRPLLNKKCFSCHGGVKRAGGVSFLNVESLSQPGESGAIPIVKGQPAKSELIRRVRSTDDSERMPPADHGPRLDRHEIELLEKWISQGGKVRIHWAYEPPQAVAPPTIKSNWPRSDIDRFVLERLESEGLRPAAEADRRTWLRRVSFDLTGLPPTGEDIHAFLSDQSDEAYSSVVERLLSSTAYGERWASVWLDLARYADTVGFERDPTRSIWPWRDWVVDAYNSDMPYDQFLVKQLAGDLLPQATINDQLATAFHRNTQTNTECGTDDEEYRNIAVMDRLNTTWEGLMSTSFRCVQCHNHPYDPFDQKEYYQVFAAFNSTQDNDCNEDFPRLSVPIRKDERGRAELLDREVQLLRTAIHEQGNELAQRTEWRPLKASRAESTGPTTMTVREVDGIPEVTATGNVKLRGVFTLEFPLASKLLTAIRIEAIPFEPERAVVASELGFVLSRLKAEIVVPARDGQGETITEVPLVAAYDEDPTAFFPAEATFDKDLAGWSAYPRFHRPRRVVFSVDKPVALSESSKLRLTMQQDAQSTGITAQVIRRARYFATDQLDWCELFSSQQQQRDQLTKLRAERNQISSIDVPVLREQHRSQRRNSHIYNRGNFLTPGDEVKPGLPAALAPEPISNRLDFARWLTRPNHPLTARSAVNRVWEQLFGRGLVETIEDFGSAATAPSHPDLLNWLAVKYSGDFGWSQKRLLRELVLSATYRQSIRSAPESRQKDSSNRLYSRGPRSRLSAEMIRDQALSAAGLLSRKTGGPPVMPVQPEGIWRTVYNASKWETSPGEDAYRRSLYTFIRRTSGYPSYQIFDAPSREFCSVRRVTTNTPLQALVTLNDPVFIEAATQLSQRMKRSGDTLESQIAFGYEMVTTQELTASVQQVLTTLYRENREWTGSDDAALMIVANALLNLDSALTR